MGNWQVDLVQIFNEKGKFGWDGLNWKWEVYHVLYFIVIYSEAWHHLSVFNPTVIYDPCLIDILSQFGMDTDIFLYLFLFSSLNFH